MPIAQKYFIDSYNKLSKLTNTVILNSDGVCYGLTLLNLKFVKEGTEYIFFDYIDIISSLTDKQMRQLYSIYKNGGDPTIVKGVSSYKFSKILDFCLNVQAAFLAQRDQRFKSVFLNWEQTDLVYAGDLSAYLVSVMAQEGDMLLVIHTGWHVINLEKKESVCKVYNSTNEQLSAFTSSIRAIREQICRRDSIQDISSLIMKQNNIYRIDRVTYGNYHSAIDQVVNVIDQGDIGKYDSAWLSEVVPIYKLYLRGSVSRQNLIHSVTRWISQKLQTVITPEMVVDFLMNQSDIKAIKSYESDTLGEVKLELTKIFEEHFRLLSKLEHDASDDFDREKIDKISLIKQIIAGNDIEKLKFYFSLKDRDGNIKFNPAQKFEGLDYLCLAAVVGSLEFITYLTTQYNMDFYCDGKDDGPLMLAAYNGHTHVLIDVFINDAKNSMRYLDQVIFKLIDSGHSNVIEKVINAIGVDWSELELLELLEHAVKNTKTDKNFIPILVRHMPPNSIKYANQIETDGLSIIGVAINNGLINDAIFLLDSGMTLNEMEKIDLKRVVYPACKKENFDKIPLLFERIAAPETPEKVYYAALDLCIPGKWVMAAFMLQQLSATDEFAKNLSIEYKNKIIQSILHSFQERINGPVTDEQLNELRLQLFAILNKTNSLGALLYDKALGHRFKFLSKKSTRTGHVITKEIAKLEKLISTIDDLLIESNLTSASMSLTNSPISSSSFTPSK